MRFREFMNEALAAQDRMLPLQSRYDMLSSEEKQRLFGCKDCGVNTKEIGEYYAVHDPVWRQSGLGENDGKLCLGCLEKRIGRQLTPEDFKKVPINASRSVKSPRFLNRLGKSPV